MLETVGAGVESGDDNTPVLEDVGTHQLASQSECRMLAVLETAGRVGLSVVQHMGWWCVCKCVVLTDTLSVDVFVSVWCCAKVDDDPQGNGEGS